MIELDSQMQDVQDSQSDATLNLGLGQAPTSPSATEEMSVDNQWKLTTLDKVGNVKLVNTWVNNFSTEKGLTKKCKTNVGYNNSKYHRFSSRKDTTESIDSCLQQEETPSRVIV